jgi:predicted RNase H-like HicB family nuclease
MRYPVIIRRTLTGYSVDVPDLPGCVATGTTVEHARQMIAEAIELHIDMMRQTGEIVPSPSTSIEFSVNDTSGEELCTWVEVEASEPMASSPAN